jgi:ParB family chromosome partitioning protein
MPEYKTVRLAQIAPPQHAMREMMDDTKLEELAASIRMDGVLVPLILCPLTLEQVEKEPEAYGHLTENARTGVPVYEIVAGHRRYIASNMAGLAEVPCRIYHEPGFSALRAKYAENRFREEVNPVEEGHFFLEIASREGITEEQLASECGEKLQYIYSRIALVKGDEQIVLAVLKGEINISVARELNMCTDEAHRRMLLNLAREAGCTVTQARMWVFSWKRDSGLIKPTAEPMQPAQQGPMVAAVLPRCVFCGQDERQYDLEMVYICRAELAALRAAAKMHPQEA